MSISVLLEQTLSPTSRKQAEELLFVEEKKEGFVVALMQTITQESIPEHVRFAASLYLKNYFKRYWENISDNDRQVVQTSLVELMTRVNAEKIQLQLSESIGIIANYEFPEEIIKSLVQKLQLGNAQLNRGLLQSLHLVFKRYRHEFPSTELFVEIKFVLSLFCDTFSSLLHSISSLTHLDQQTSECLLLLCKLYIDLNSQDVPEYFEDHQDQLLPIFIKYLQLPSIDQRIKSSICELCELNLKKYKDVIRYQQEFIQSILQIFSSTESVSEQLIGRALMCITIAVQQQISIQVDVQELIQKVILPNLKLSEDDLELFEDDPQEYLRRDFEGSDAETRRRSAAELLSALTSQYQVEITQLLSQFIQQQFISPDWLQRDLAWQLLIALSTQAKTAQLGATRVNELIPLQQLFQAQVLPELQSKTHPILVVDCLKFIQLFRSQLNIPDEAQKLICDLLVNDNYLVFTVASICIERLLTARKFSLINVDLINNLFVSLSKSQSNEYLIKCLWKSLQQFSLTPDLQLKYCQQLLQLLEPILQNSINPRFNHFLFESLATCLNQSHFNSEVERLMHPVIQVIMQMDCQDFLPYTLQLMNLLMQKSPNQQQYQPLFQLLLQPVLWENNGNIPALVQLLETFIQNNSNSLDSLLPQLLGIVQKLLSSRSNDQCGFQLLSSLFQRTQLKQYMQPLLNLMLMRLQQASTQKYRFEFSRFLFEILPVRGLHELINDFNQLQQGLFQLLIEQVLIQELPKLLSNIQCRSVVPKSCLLLTNSPQIPMETRLKLFVILLDNHKFTSTASSLVNEEEQEVVEDYHHSFNQLQSVKQKKKVVDTVVDLMPIIKQSIPVDLVPKLTPQQQQLIQ